MAGVGVERIFNFARDMCGYRRGQLLPDTIRALLLVYFHQISESRINELQRILYSTMNINDMTQEEMETEIQAREKEVNLRRTKADKWDEDQYISDIDPEEGGPSRTLRNQQRADRIAAKQRSISNRHQELSISQRNQREALQQLLIERDQRDRQNEDLYNIVKSSADDLPQDSSHQSDDSELELPKLPKEPYITRSRQAVSPIPRPKGQSSPRPRPRPQWVQGGIKRPGGRDIVDSHLAKRTRS